MGAKNGKKWQVELPSYKFWSLNYAQTIRACSNIPKQVTAFNSLRAKDLVKTSILFSKQEEKNKQTCPYMNIGFKKKILYLIMNCSVPYNELFSRLINKDINNYVELNNIVGPDPNYELSWAILTVLVAILYDTYHPLDLLNECSVLLRKSLASTNWKAKCPFLCSTCSAPLL